MSDNAATTIPAPNKIPLEEAGRTQNAGFVGKTAVAAILVAAAYYAGAKLGFVLKFDPTPISVFWPPNALLLAGLLLTPTRAWWIILLAVLPAHLLAQLQSGVPTIMVLAWFASNCSEALLGAATVRLFAGTPLRLDSFRQMCVFLACAVALAPFASTFVDIGLIKAIGWGEGDFLQLMRMRLLSNALATLILVPVILTWANGGLQSLRGMPLRRCMEAGAVFLGLVVAGVLVFEHTGQNSAGIPALLYVPLPFLLWAAVRLGPPSVTLGLLVTFALATWGAIHGYGPFIDNSTEQNALSVQLFLIAVSVPILMFSAVMEEHKKDKSALERSEQRALTVFRASPDPIAIVRFSDGVLLDVNDRWERYFGYSRDEAIGRTAAQLGIYANDKDRGTYFDLVRKGLARDFEVIMANRAGQVRYAMLSGESVEIDGSPCFVTVTRDVTRQKLAERESKEQRVELMHLSRVAMLGELSGALAHELKQPLTAILSNAQAAQRLLAKKTLDLEELHEVLRDIASEDKRAGEVIQRLRDMFRKGEVQFQRLDANDLVRDTLSLAYGNLATRHIQVSQQLCGLPVVTYGDKVQLQQVLLNLVVNACEAMESPGSVRELTLQTAPLGDGQVQIFVIDGGPGVPADLVEKLFDPFFTTKPQGLGLGLSISRSIVTAHGGQLHARNNSGCGATFRVVLPGQAVAP